MHIVSCSSSQTLAFGKRIARHLKRGDIICLAGELGSGKTVFAKGVISGLGIPPSDVISPTFVLIRQYEAMMPVYHFDLYRLDDPLEIENIGYEEYFYDDGITLVEWAERLQHLMPAEFLMVKFKIVSPLTRSIHVTARGRKYEELLERIGHVVKK